MSRSLTAIIGLPGLHNVRRVGSMIYCVAWPEDIGYQTMKTMGIKTRINLRKWHADEEQCKTVGIDYLAFPMSELDPPHVKDMQMLTAMLQNETLWPIAIGCLSASDRTGYAIACYRMQVCGWTFAESKEEMLRFVNPWADLELWPAVNKRMRELEA